MTSKDKQLCRDLTRMVNRAVSAAGITFSPPMEETTPPIDPQVSTLARLHALWKAGSIVHPSPATNDLEDAGLVERAEVRPGICSYKLTDAGLAKIDPAVTGEWVGAPDRRTFALRGAP